MGRGTTGAAVRNVVWAVTFGATAAFAQPPQVSDPIYDPAVTPAQRLEPPVPPASVPDTRRNPAGTTVPTGVATTPARGFTAVVDPPSPVVQLKLRTPAHVPEGKPVPYRVTVVNTSAAKALRVTVRMPWPEGAATLAKCEPKPAGAKDALPPPGSQLLWEVGDLPRGEQKTIELSFTPTPDAKKVAATAYVGFEYGERVETSVAQPKVSVAKTATPELAVGELITVRVQVSNPGPVAIPKVRLVEQAPKEAEFRGDDGAEKTNLDGQRAWDLGTIAPGQAKIVQYQLLARKPGEVTTTSNVSSGEVPFAPEQATSTTKVLQPALQLTFTGPATAEPKAPASYTAVVRNTGTLPLGEVRLIVDVPDGLAVKKRTNGATVDAGRHAWTTPRLAPGEAQEFHLQVEPEPGVSGKKLVKAAARDARGLVEVQTGEAVTDFVGKADLTWKPRFDKAMVPVGRQGTLTVSVLNQGAESDNGVRLRVKLPPEVRYLGTAGVIDATYENAEVLFQLQKIPPGKQVEFTLNYEGKTEGKGRFSLLLEGESLGGKPLSKEQVITVSR